MSKLEKLINELCPHGVEYRYLGNILKSNNALVSISKKDYQDFGEIPIIDQSQTYISGYTDNEVAIPPIIPCIVFGDHTRVIKYSDKRFAQGESGTKVFVPISNQYNTKYIFYAFCNIDIQSRGYNRHWSIVKDMKIPIPPLDIQNEIVRILDNFTELIEELSAELTARKQQYDYYKNKLLIFDINMQKYEVGKILKRTKGTNITAQQMSLLNKQNGEVRIFAGGKTIADVDFKDIPRKDIHTEPSIIVKSRGNIGFEYYDKPFSHKNEFWSYHSEDENINLKYVYYYLQHNINYFQNIANNMQMPQISIPVTDKYLIPIPSIEKQNYIVGILDKFDKLVNDISEGIPAEIAARQKQYEYYRDKLLTFKEVGNESI